MYKILIVEDDPAITGVLERALERWQYQPVAAEDFSRIGELFEQTRPDLVLMDIFLPFYNGYYWCQEIRKISQVPIIFISSAEEDMNLVMAVNMGADDFLSKPFALEVVLAKIQALLRRTYDFTASVNVLRAGEAVLSLNDAVLTYKEERLELSRNEFGILRLLMEHRGSTVSRDEMMQRLWDSEEFIDDNTLTVNMTRLRRKLEGIGLKGWIETKKGMGYLLP